MKTGASRGKQMMSDDALAALLKINPTFRKRNQKRIDAGEFEVIGIKGESRGGDDPLIKEASRKKIRQKKREMNSTEKRFEMEKLMPMVHTGEIKKYWHESIRLELGNNHWYKCDFQAVNADGKTIFYEVKGGLEKRQKEAGIANVKTAASKYDHFEFWLCVHDSQLNGWFCNKVLP